MAGANLTFTLIGRDHSASSALRNVGDESEKAHGKLGKLGGMGKVAGLAVATGVGAAAAGAVVAGKAMWDMTKAAGEDEAAQKRLAREMRNTAGATAGTVAKAEDWISTQGKALGVTDDQLRPALARLVRSTHDVGESQDLARLAMDASAGTGKSLESVATALAKAHDGNVGALARLGVQTKDASGKTLEFDQITANMAKTFDGQATQAADTLGGKMGRLRLTFDETKESVGAKFLPVAEKVGTWLLDTAVPAVQNLGEKVMPVLQGAWDKVSKAFEDARPGLEEVGKLIGAVGQFIADKVVPVIVDLHSTYISKLIEAIGFIGSHLDEVGAMFLGFAATGVGAFKNLYTGATGVLEGILTVAEKTMGWIPGIGDKIRAAKQGFSDFRDHTIEKLGQVEDGIRNAQQTLATYDERARADHVAKLKADITDLDQKLVTAVRGLKDPELTKERKAEIKADIADLKAKKKEALEELEALPKSKEVALKVRMTVHADYKARQVSGGGGMGGDGGTSPSSGLMAATSGVGHPGAVFGQRGPMWSWNRVNGIGQHDGADISAAAGTGVYATRAGHIVGVGTSGWAGNHVVWEANGTRYIYAHLSKILKSSGAVSSGTLLGRVGATGHATGPHLHVQASRDGHYVNPAAYLASGGIVRARPGGVPVVIGEGAYDEAVIPLPRGGGLGVTEVHFHFEDAIVLGSKEDAARWMTEAQRDLKRRTGVDLGLA